MFTISEVNVPQGNLRNIHSKATGRARKNSGGKKQAYYQSQVTTGKRRPDGSVVLGEWTHRSVD